MHGLQTVPHVGQGAAHDDGHGVFDIGLLHLRHKGALHDVLVREAYLFRVVLGLFAHILFSLSKDLHSLAASLCEGGGTAKP